MKLPWPDLLDALEERNRRCAALLASNEDEPVHLPDVDLRAEGRLPPELALRARLVLSETARLEQLAAQKLSRTRTALHYRQAGGAASWA